MERFSLKKLNSSRLRSQKCLITGKSLGYCKLKPNKPSFLVDDDDDDGNDDDNDDNVSSSVRENIITRNKNTEETRMLVRFEEYLLLGYDAV
jgi:hypothetical protein